MKKLLAILLAALMLVSLCACGSKTITDSEHLTINGMYVDESSEDDGEKVLYIAMTYKAGDTNGSVSASMFNIKINDTNEYSNEYSQSLKLPYTDYYYDKFVEDVKVGETLNLYAAIKVPVNDLVDSKPIAIIEDIEGVDKLKLSTDMIVFAANKEEICKAIDEAVYNRMKAEEEEKLVPVSSSEAEFVYNYLSGGYFTYRNSIIGRSDYYELAFSY